MCHNGEKHRINQALLITRKKPRKSIRNSQAFHSGGELMSGLSTRNFRVAIVYPGEIYYGRR